jgi:hypothetical protein
MKYFTRELIERLGSMDDAMADVANAEWEDAVDRHENQLQAIREQLPVSLHSLWNNFYLHDADVLAMGRKGQTFVIVLRLDVPPRELLILKYHLVEEPIINKDALPPEARCNYIQWMYDEIGWVGGEKAYATHTILFCNGWEVELHLRDLEVIAAQTLFPDNLQPTSPDAQGVGVKEKHSSLFQPPA